MNQDVATSCHGFGTDPFVDDKLSAHHALFSELLSRCITSSNIMQILTSTLLTFACVVFASAAAVNGPGEISARDEMFRANQQCDNACLFVWDCSIGCRCAPSIQVGIGHCSALRLTNWRWNRDAFIGRWPTRCMTPLARTITIVPEDRGATRLST